MHPREKYLCILCRKVSFSEKKSVLVPFKFQMNEKCSFVHVSKPLKRIHSLFGCLTGLVMLGAEPFLNGAQNTTQWAQRGLRQSIILHLLQNPIFLLFILVISTPCFPGRNNELNETDSENFTSNNYMWDIIHPKYIFQWRNK